ncbi:haloacid dehalogenase-like hydrolase domain-containing protein 2 [Mycena alexandri]|uniref:Haloacid dehalogenase-like hydrolase domain-containing protein 2 n=1 Tax=Mycena alexandri TaxID=1745969 RepID=A0AAD6SB73_9AGAR|nr:haloacid dehalogenase-like hydrolase domain-containing protein 2 [Mycena alexandri]
MRPRPRLRALLIDISGTLHVGSKPTPSAIDANTSKESTHDVSQRLRKLGFEVQETPQAGYKGPREVWTSVGSVRRVGTLQANVWMRAELQLDPGLKEDDKTPFDAVVVGLCPARLDYTHLNTAFRILAREHPVRSPDQPVLIAAHTGRFLESSDGGLALGPGPFVAALEHAVMGVKARVVGKPTRTFFEAVIADIGAYGSLHGDEIVTPPPDARVAIIGDDIEADLGEGALELGLWRVLVRTGKYRPGDETRAPHPPDEVVDSFAAFIDSFFENTM